VGRRLLRLEIPVFPERGMFLVYDSAVELDAPAGPVPPASGLIGTSREQMIVACAQEHVSVQLTIEEWEDVPPPFSDGYEDEAKCVLYLRGRLSVMDTGRSDLALDSLRLAGGVGDYGVHVYTRNRTVQDERRPPRRRVSAGEEAAGGAGAVPGPALARIMTLVAAD